MSPDHNYKVLVLGVIVLAVLISLTVVFSYVQAELAEGVTQAQVDAALQDLSQVAGKVVTSQAEAQAICNQDKYLADCAEIGKEHNLFPPEQVAQVNTILDEIKGQVADQIKSCQNIECLVGVAQGLAAKISRKDPSLASQIDLTPTIVREKKEIVELAKSVGLTIDQCIEMDPDTAPVELLRGCAKLAKENKVKKYVPTETRAQLDTIVDSTEQAVQLKEALASGRYQCGDNTVSGCGNFCLNPGAEARAAGTSAIPAVCRQIASEIFGPQGVRELENAYSRVSGVADYYYKKAQNFVFTTLDGRTLTNPAEIGSYLEAQGKAGNVEAVSKGMDFMVAQGFATQADKDFAVKMVGKFRERGGVSNFDLCVQDPKACKDFIHDDFQNSFDVMDQVFEIMRQELGFSPDLCEQGQFDQSIGLKCLEGGKRALPKIEALASKYPEVRFIVEEIRTHLERGDQLAQKKDQFIRGTFSGPGGCKNEKECFIYCSNPGNGPECIAFGSKEGLSGFTGDQAVTKYKQYEYSLNRPAIEEEYITRGGPPFGGPYGDVPYPPGFPPPFYGGPQGQPPYGPPYGVPPYGPGPGYPTYPPGSQSQYGPSPECLRAITSGDFVTAKQVCNVVVGGPQPVPGQPFPSPIICPALPYIECPVGQYHESFRNSDGCFVEGPCKPIPTYSPGPYPTYSPGPYPTGPYPIPGIGACYNDPCAGWPGPGECLIKAPVRPVSCDDPSCNTGPCRVSPPLGGGFCGGVAGIPCPAGYNCQLDGNYPDAGGRCIGVPYPTYSPGPGGSTCSKSLFSLLGNDCHQMYTDSTGRAIFCDGPMTKSAKEGDTVATSGCYGPGGPGPTYTPYPSPGICPAGYHSHGEQGGFCMNDQENYSGTCYSADGKTIIKCPSQPTGQCTPPQWWDPAKGYCVGSTISPSPVPSTCPAGYHWHGESGGFCMNDREDYAGTCYTADGKTTTTCPKPTYPSPQTCPSGQWWDPARNACVPSTTTYTPAPSCPAGQWWDYTYKTCTSATPPPSCPSGQWWDSATSSCKSTVSGGSCPTGSHSMGNYCMSDADLTKCGPLNSSSTSGFGSCSSYQTTYTNTPVPSCPSGQWWDYARNVCVSSTATYTPPPSCPTGQWWDSTTQTCKPNITTYTYTPYPSPSVICGNAICEGAETSATCPADCGVGTATTYTPYPTTAYTPYPSCPSGQWWDSVSNSCQGSTTTYTPYPTTQYTPYPTTQYTPPPYSPPPPTSGTLYNHFASLHCLGLGRVWDGQYCQPTGFLARVIENVWANLGKLIGF